MTDDVAAALCRGGQEPPGWLAAQLPEALIGGAQGLFLRRFLGGFEDVGDGLRERIDGVEHHLDAGIAPPASLPWLAGWLGRDVDPSLEPARARAIVRAAGTGLRERGTAAGLRRLLEAYTGGRVEVVDSGGVHLPGAWRPRAPVVGVRLDHTGGHPREQIRQLVQREVPAGVRVELVVGAEPEEPEPRDGD